MDRKLRRLILLVAVAFAAALICSAFLMAFAAGHRCHHENCQICAIAGVCQSVVKSLGKAAALAHWGLMAVCLGAVCLSAALPFPLLPTPVSDKVKLSN